MADKRTWVGEFTTRAEVDTELGWLREHVYGGRQVTLDLDEFDAKTRYSERDGKREKVRT